jgi:hypothetical protein
MSIFLNEYEIEAASADFGHIDTPNLNRAAHTLQNLVNVVNNMSDGWPYWQAPRKAAQKLMKLVHDADRWDPSDVTDAAYKAALTPLKSFCTKHNIDQARVIA